MSCTQLLKTVAYSKLLQHNTSPVSHNQDVFLFDWQELLLGIKACYYLSCLCQIGIDWCHLLSGTARSEYTLPCELWACCWRWLLSVYAGFCVLFHVCHRLRFTNERMQPTEDGLVPLLLCSTHTWHPWKAVLCTCGSTCMLTCAVWNDFQYSVPLWWLIPSFILQSCTSSPLFTFVLLFPPYLHAFYPPSRPQRPLHLEK